MLIIFTTISILVITALVWLANRIMPFQVCPICAGVSLTWIGLITAHFLGYQIILTIPALLMGGSVVGIAYQLEKKLLIPTASWRSPILWKTLFIPAGFVAAYGILAQLWIEFFAALTFLLLISFLFLSPNGKSTANKGLPGKLEKKMDNCC